MRRLTALAAAAVLIGPGLVVATPGTPATAAPLEAPVERADVLTLITGDVVTITRTGDRAAATVRPAAGREHITFHTVEADGGLRVLPSDAIARVSDGTLDADLFDVERLVADGYGDAASPALPLIVTSPAGLRTTAARSLPSIGATAVRADKASLAAFWRGSTLRAAGIGKIWLDGKVRTRLDRSTAQIGAPAAWQAGYDGRGVKVAVLDTGVDATHPDVAGKITGTRVFSDTPDVSDHHGHGTHVAATVAGSGAASGGSRKGVAHGADLLIGKVMNDQGSGHESWIIAGMQWAADSGAKVVNLSLGGDPTDGTDPMSEALTELTERTGTLFVVAAGNEGRAYSVGTPGVAPAALTVGAVDRDETLADFSSRGPTAVRNSLKPEITAPGVRIVAARAAGTSMGGPVDERYTAANGTSMATPHVAGAAAVLAQQHPGWTPAQLKDALVSTAKTAPGSTVYGQGAGRVDLARATAQTVRGTGVADFGDHSAGESPTRHSRVIAYTNDGVDPLTLTLTLPAGVSGPRSVTVPARGTASVTVEVDTATIDPGLHSGWIVATGPAGQRVTTAFGLRLGAPHHLLTLRAVGRDGKPARVPALTIFGNDPEYDRLGYIMDEEVTYDLGADDYIITALIEGGDPQHENASYIVLPELRLDRDLEIVLDARTGTPIRIETPQPAEQQSVLSYYAHRETAGGRGISHGVMHFSNVQDVYVTPTRPVRGGRFEFSSRWQLVEPDVQATVPGVTVQPRMNMLGNSPDFPGVRTFPLAGPGAADLRGKAVLLHSDSESEDEQVRRAYAAGAAVALLIRPADWSTWTVLDPEAEKLPIPALTVTAADGKRLLRRAQRPDPRITLELTTASPYLYDVIQVSKNRVPEKIVHRVTAANTRRITTDYAHNGGFGWVREQRFGWRPWQEYAWNDTSRAVPTPFRRVEWVSAGDSLWQHQVHPAYPWMPLVEGGFTEAAGPVRPGAAKEAWAAPVVRPATPRGYASTREGDVLKLRVADMVDSSDRHFTFAEGTTAELRRDGTLLAELPAGWGDVTTTPGDARYELAVRTSPGSDEWIHGTRTATSWRFSSAADGVLPLLQVGYDVAPRRVGFDLSTGGKPARGTTLRAEWSADDGATWQLLKATGSGPAWSAPVPAHDTPVSLRVTATDRAGNTITQTVIRAFG